MLQRTKVCCLIYPRESKTKARGRDREYSYRQGNRETREWRDGFLQARALSRYFVLARHVLITSREKVRVGMCDKCTASDCLRHRRVAFPAHTSLANLIWATVLLVVLPSFFSSWDSVDSPPARFGYKHCYFSFFSRDRRFVLWCGCSLCPPVAYIPASTRKAAFPFRWFDLHRLLSSLRVTLLHVWVDIWFVHQVTLLISLLPILLGASRCVFILSYSRVCAFSEYRDQDEGERPNRKTRCSRQSVVSCLPAFFGVFLFCIVGF